MERIKRALERIKADNTSAEAILAEEIELDRAGTIAWLAAFLVAALSGVVIDPENL